MTPLTAKKYSGWRYGAAYALLFLCVFPDTVLAAYSNTSASLGKTDIMDVGMDMYTSARKWEESNGNGYTREALKWFTKKLNAALKEHSAFVKFYEKNGCDWCDAVVDEGFDEALLQYLQTTPPDTTSGEKGYVIVVSPFLDDRVLPLINIDNSRALGSLIAGMVKDIHIQVREQMDAYRDVSGMGLYYDGNRDNSPYDLMDDVRRIDEIFFREAPEFGEYTNTSSDDAGALITGRIGTGTWGGGENYDIDILSDISGALGGDSESGNGSGGGGGKSDDCESGYCTTIDFIQNTHYFLGGGSWVGRNSFQGVFEEWLDWIIKNGDNRNFACKVSPTSNTWESEFDLNLVLWKVFSGVSSFVFWKTPPFLEGFFDRNKEKKEKGAATAAATGTPDAGIAKKETKENKETDDALKTAFRRRGLDHEKPTNIKGSLWQALESATVKNATKNAPAIETVNALERASDEYHYLLLAAGSGTQRPYAHEKSTESIKHMEKTFDDIGIRARMLHQLSRDLNTVLRYISDKEECQSA